MSDFNIYLPSNVAPDTFPSNSPSKFSTILADDINLNGGNWEVGVTNILYPTHVSSTSDCDKITIYEDEKPRQMFGKDIGAKVKYTLKLNVGNLAEKPAGGISMKQANMQNEAELIAAFFNRSKWNNLFRFEYKAKQKKFVLHNNKKDVFIGMSSQLRKYLGFKKLAFFKGSHWAWSVFNPQVHVPPTDGTAFLYLIDLTRIEKEDIHFSKSHDISNDEWIFTTRFMNRFRDAKDDDLLYEPQLEITLHPTSSVMKIWPTKFIPKELLQYEIPMLLLQFHDNAAKALNMDNDTKNFVLYNDNEHTIQKAARFNIPKRSKEEILAMTDITATLYYCREKEIVRTRKKDPLKTLIVSAKKEVKKPQDLLPYLNAGAETYGFKFTFLEDVNRFHMDITGQYYIEMSPSLRSILGFGDYAGYIASAPTSFRGEIFPVLHRSITTLYTYTNIVEVVHVGDVKAALLLACPFTTDKDSNVRQIEFLRPTYCKVNRQRLKQIDVEIRDDAGDLIPFLYGKTVITLHFRQIK